MRSSVRGSDGGLSCSSYAAAVDTSLPPAFPPPSRPLPERPTTASSSSTRKRHRRDQQQLRRHGDSPSASISSASSASTTSTSFLIAGARPDSTILPLSTPVQRPLVLERENFHALVRKGDVVQYWLAVEVVLRGLPGRTAMPNGHWERLVRLAEEVNVDGGRQLVTGWCMAQERLEGDGNGRYIVLKGVSAGG